MKKRLLLATLTLVCAAAGVCGLAACEEEHEHAWDGGTVTKAATCTEAGEKTFACTHEGCEETKTEAIEATGHAWDEGTVKKAANCTEAGEKTFTCTHEGCEETKTEAIEATGHAWDEGTVKKAATCTEAGETTFACTHDGCGETKTETVKATGHDWNDWTTEPATCEEGGCTYRTCKHDEKHLEEKDKTEALGHDWDDWDVLFTEDLGGQASKSCKRDGCGGHEMVELPALSERTAYNAIDSATCTQDGTLKYVYTTDDGEEITAYEVASPAKGHNFGAPQYNDATADKKGNITYECACGYKEVYEYDEKTTGYGSGKEAGKTYYVTNTNPETSTDVKSMVYGYQNFVLKKGVYEFSFTYLDSKKFNIQEAVTRGTSIVSGSTRNQVVKDGAVADKYKDNVFIEFVDGNPAKMTIIVDGTVIPADSKMVYAMTTSLEPGETSGILMSIGYEGAKEIAAGDNTVKITTDGATADTSEDRYEFTSATAKKYSITVPENIVVLLDGKDLITTGTWANFEAKAGVKMVFTFLGAKGDHTVTIGDEKKETIGFDKPVMVTASGKVTYNFADGLEEKEYIVKVVLGQSVRQYMTIVFNDPDAPIGGNYSGSGTKVDLGKGWADSSGDNYSVHYGTGTEAGTAYITLTLKGGDSATFIYNAGTAVCEVCLVDAIP